MPDTRKAHVLSATASASVSGCPDGTLPGRGAAGSVCRDGAPLSERHLLHARGFYGQPVAAARKARGRPRRQVPAPRRSRRRLASAPIVRRRRVAPAPMAGRATPMEIARHGEQLHGWQSSTTEPAVAQPERSRTRAASACLRQRRCRRSRKRKGSRRRSRRRMPTVQSIPGPIGIGIGVGGGGPRGGRPPVAEGHQAAKVRKAAGTLTLNL